MERLLEKLEAKGLITNPNLALVKSMVLHSGKAHADDMYLAGLVKALVGNNIKTFRRPTASDEDLKNVEVLVGDIGGEYDPSYNNYDHHQDDDTVNGKTALSLFVEANVPFLMEDEGIKALVKRVNAQDNGGFRATKEALDVDFKQAQGFLFSEFALTTMFEANPDSVASIIAQFWVDKIEFMNNVLLCKDWIEKNHVLATIGSIETLIFINKPPFDTFVFNKAQTDIIDRFEVDLCVGYDPRTEGARTLFRTYHGSKKGIDLSKVEVKGKIFAHKGGFLLTFVPESKRMILDILSEIL